MGTRLWQDGADQQVFHCLYIPTFARCLSIFVESPFLHKGYRRNNNRLNEHNRNTGMEIKLDETDQSDDNWWNTTETGRGARLSIT